MNMCFIKFNMDLVDIFNYFVIRLDAHLIKNNIYDKTIYLTALDTTELALC